MTQLNGNQSMPDILPKGTSVDDAFTHTTTAKIKPATRGGSSACVTRRVGGDQNGSASLSACRRTKRKEPTAATRATPAQNTIKLRGAATPKLQPVAAAAKPKTPLKIMMGASARR